MVNATTHAGLPPPYIVASQSHITHQNGATSGFEMCCAQHLRILRCWGSQPKHVSITLQNEMAQRLDSRCALLSDLTTFGAGVPTKTGLESSIKKFNHVLFMIACFLRPWGGALRSRRWPSRRSWARRPSPSTRSSAAPSTARASTFWSCGPLCLWCTCDSSKVPCGPTELNGTERNSWHCYDPKAMCAPNSW